MNEKDATDPRAQWPGDVDEDGPWGAEAFLRYLASQGVACSAVSIDLLPPLNSDRDAYGRWFTNLYCLLHAHDTYLALSALRELDPAKADEIADRCVLAGLAGDAYGEWTWAWAVEHGLDAQAISDDARAKIAEGSDR